MKNTFKILRLWAEGLLLLCLRWVQLKTGFDPATGLSRYSLPGTLLAAAILLLAAVEIFLAVKLPRGKFSYQNAFLPMKQKHLPLLAAGSFLLAAGAVLQVSKDTLPLLTAAAGVIAAVGLILFAKQVRSSGEIKSFPLLPVMAFTVLFVMMVYLPQDSSPVLARYYLPVLSSCFAACAFYQLAGFPCRMASMRWFIIFGNLSVPLSIACIPDSFGNWGHLLVYAGYALILTAFLALRRDAPAPEPEENAEDGAPVQE